MHKVGRLAHTHQWRARVYIFHPGIHLFIGPERQIPQLFFRLNFEAERLEIDALDIFDLLKVAYLLRSRCRLSISLVPSERLKNMPSKSGRHTSFLNTCSSVPPKTNHFLLHIKLLRPSSLILAGPVLTTVFLPGGGDGDKADAELRIGNELE
jgi:hypothetical protein